MSTVTPLPLGAAVPSLTRWGLTSDADLVFRTLATFGPRTGRSLTTELGLPRHRVGTALAELRECGAATVSEQHRTDRWAAVWTGRPSAQVVATLRARRFRPADPAAQAHRHREVVQTVNARMTGLGLPVAPTTGGLLGDGLRFLSTRTLGRQRLAEVMSAEQHDHLAINTESVFDATSRTAGAPLSRSAAARGIRFRVLGRPPADGDALDPASTDHLVNGTSYQYRELSEPPLKLFICDRRLAIFPVDPMNFERGFLEVAQPPVVAALIALFERHWSTAVDPQLQGVPTIVLSERERELIKLLARGHTDVTAAQTLQISARSITNVLRAVMDRIGVDNRFQLGLALGAMRVAAPPSIDERTVAAPAS
jgi:DNA-binding CsgD family transcriptional regulator